CECAICHATGIVKDASPEEMAECVRRCAGRGARPYRWPHPERAEFFCEAAPFHFVEANPAVTFAPGEAMKRMDALLGLDGSHDCPLWPRLPRAVLETGRGGAVVSPTTAPRLGPGIPNTQERCCRADATTDETPLQRPSLP